MKFSRLKFLAIVGIVFNKNSARKFQFLKCLALLLASFLVITACKGTTSVTPKTDQPPLKVVYSLWAGYFPLVIAQEKGFFEQQGVKVESLYTDSYLNSVSSFSASKADGLATTLGSIMSIIGKEPDLQIPLITDESAGADVVVAQNKIKSIADLKGKRIAAKVGDFGELLITHMLQKSNLTTDDVNLLSLEPESVPKRLQTGDIQAGHTWFPYTLEATKAGAKILFSSNQTPGLIPGLFVFRSKVLRDRPDEIKAFIRGWFQAQDYWQTNPEESKQLIAKKLNLKPEEISTEGIRLYQLKDNLAGFTQGSTTASLYHTAKLYSDFFIQKGGLSTAPDIQKLIVPSFVEQLGKLN